jgi:LCP family protein required for cell wall assembly
VDFVNQEVSALDIPRTIQVDIPDVIPSKYGCSEARTNGLLNQAYLWGTEGFQCSNVPGYGAGLLARTLDANFGVQVDHYVVVNMTTLASAIDAIGGVPFYVYDTIDDRQAPYLPAIPQYGYFEAGSHWFTGVEAVRYARIRSINGIFGRHNRQNEILVQLRDRVMDPEIISSIPGLVEVFYGRVLTDLSLEQVSQLTCLGVRLTMDDIHFVSLPQEMFTEAYNYDGHLALYSDLNAVGELIDDFVNGRPLSLTE